MRTKAVTSVRIAVSTVLVLGVIGCGDRALEQVAQSHVDANVPPETDFDRFMRRDLAAYFGATADKPIEVAYELLRDGPTQTGVAYPKYYVWVVASTGEGEKRGAARVAAVERKEFQVTDFLSESDLRARPEAAYSVFPAPVCERIKARLGIGR